MRRPLVLATSVLLAAGIGCRVSLKPLAPVETVVSAAAAAEPRD